MISEKLNASRKSAIDKGSYFALYVKHCDYEISFNKPTEIITSDDIFDYLLNVIQLMPMLIDKKKDYVKYIYKNTDF